MTYRHRTYIEPKPKATASEGYTGIHLSKSQRILVKTLEDRLRKGQFQARKKGARSLSLYIQKHRSEFTLLETLKKKSFDSNELAVIKALVYSL